MDVKQNIVESAVSKELKSRKVGADVVNKVSKIVSKYMAGERLSSSEQGYLKHNNVAATVVQEIKAAQEQIKSEAITPAGAKDTASTSSAPQWALDMVKSLSAVDSAVGVIKYAATGKTEEDKHQAEVNRMIKLLSIASGKTTAEQEAQSGDIPYSQYIKEKETSAQKENTAESSGETTETNIEENGVRYSIIRHTYTEEIIEENLRELAQMSSVADISEEKLQKTGKKPSEIFSDFFNSLNNNIYTEEFGDVALPHSSVKSEIRHGITAEKIASIEAIPNVLNEGKVIFAKNKTGSDVERVVVCAPIKIGESSYYMGIMLQRDSQNQRLYLHNVVIEEETSQDSQADLLTTGADEQSEHLFMTNILQKALSVKKEYVQGNSNNTTHTDNFNGFSKVDVSEDDVTYESRLLHTMRGAKITTDGQAYIKRICQNLGIDVVFENVFTPKGKHADGYIDDNGVIHIDYHCSNPVEFVLKHELTHFGETSSLYKSFCKAVLSSDVFGEWISSKVEDGDTVTLKTAIMREQIADLYKRNGVELSPAKQQNELIANFVGEVLFSSDTNGLERLTTNMTVKEKKSVIDYIKSFIAYIKEKLSKVKGVSSEILSLERKFNELISTADKNKIAESGEKSYSLNIKHSDGTVEVLADARNLTDEQTISYLEQAKKGLLKGHSYIPVRKDTPQVIIDTLEAIGQKVKNLSLVMQVRKAQQAMSTQNNGAKSKYGDNVRKHALTPGSIVEIMNNLDNPSTVILQTNRYGKNGEPLSDNVAVFVEYGNIGNEGLAVIEFESFIDGEFVDDKFGETSFHTVVTVFEPDTQRGGIDFDYAEELLQNPDNYELNIKRRQPIRSVTQVKQPNTSNELPSKYSISNLQEGVNENFSTEKQQSDFENIEDKQTSGKYSIAGDVESSDIEARDAAQLTDFPDLMAVLTDRRKRGEISEEDYMIEVRDLLDRANEKYGVMEQGELAENITVPFSEDAKAEKRKKELLISHGGAVYIINFEESAYHQDEVLNIINAKFF